MSGTVIWIVVAIVATVACLAGLLLRVPGVGFGDAVAARVPAARLLHWTCWAVLAPAVVAGIAG